RAQILVQAALGDLDLQAAGREIRIEQQAKQLLRKPRIAQLQGRDVDRERQGRVPLARLDQRLTDQRFRKISDHVDFFGDGDENLGRYEAKPRRVPTREHLKADQVAGGEIDLLFEIGGKLASG